MLTLRRLKKPLSPDAIEIIASLLGWLALPLRFSQTLLPLHRTVLAISGSLGWLRFLLTSFSFSPTLGPLVLIVLTMLRHDVMPFLIVYFCFFGTFQTALLGFFAGYDLDSAKSTSPYTQFLLLIRMTVNPDTSLFYELDGTSWGALFGAQDDVQFVVLIWATLAGWMLLSHIVLINLLIAMMSNT